MTPISLWHTLQWWKVLTEGQDNSTAAGEDTQSSVVLGGHSILDCRRKEADGASDGGALDALLDGVHRVVDFVLSGRHVFRSGGGRRRGQQINWEGVRELNLISKVEEEVAILQGAPSIALAMIGGLIEKWFPAPASEL